MRFAHGRQFAANPVQQPQRNPLEPPVSPFRPVEILPGAANQRLILFCDHARSDLPPAYGDLGLPPEAMRRHIAYDLGAEAVTRKLAGLTGAAAAFACFSRLLIDPNRAEDDPTLVMRLSDGAIIPGNAYIDDVEISRRIETYWRPYRRACADLVEKVRAERRVPVLLGIHSFTPRFKRKARPWQVGVLWDQDPRLAQPLIRSLREDHGLTVGDNEPYDGALYGDSMYELSTRRGLPGALIEIRQDLLSKPEHCDAWAEILAGVLQPLLKREDLAREEYYGSRALCRLS
jgi:predicted N-formylglutamate amidohydrolase